MDNYTYLFLALVGDKLMLLLLLCVLIRSHTCLSSTSNINNKHIISILHNYLINNESVLHTHGRYQEVVLMIGVVQKAWVAP